MELVSVNGEVSSPKDAKISVFDRGFLFGDGVYEVARSYGYILFALEEHIERLFNSASRIGLDIGKSPEEIKEEIYRVYKLAKQPDMYVRIIITRGEVDQINIDPSHPSKCNTVIYVKELGKSDPANYSDGVDIVTASVFRNPKKSLDPNIKSGNYLNNVMAIGEAKAKKAYDALMINSQGYVTEGPTWNIVIVKNGTYITPPDDSDILLGITRKILRKICNQNKLKWEERNFTPDDVKAADEAFSTGSVKEIMAIRSLDGVKIGSGKVGEATRKLSALYKEYIADYIKDHS